MIQILLVELGLVAFAVILALAVPQFASARFASIERYFHRIASNRRGAILFVAATSLALGLILRLLFGAPRPQTYDEFSYLLAADTFAHGRVTNPPHPLWQHFESFHINAVPTYMSMYPPLQGLILALGKVTGGHVWFGLWWSVAAMCAALVWMLQAWLPPSWALYGGLLAVVRIGAFSYWAQSYWGGAIAATGGALLLGALPRLMKRPAVANALLLGAGVAIVLNSRPFEGLCQTIPVAVAVLLWLLSGKGPPLRLAARVILPMLLLLATAASAMAYYNWRVTGNPLEMPYMANRKQYAAAQVFFWQNEPPVPVYHHKVMRDFFLGWELTGYRISRKPGGFESCFYEKVVKIWLFFYGPVLSLSLLTGWRVIKDRRTRLLVYLGGASSVLMLASIYFNPHYAAPFTALIYALMLQGLRHLRHCRFRGRASGVFLVRAVPVICVVMLAFPLLAGPLRLNLVFGLPTWCSRFTPDYRREDVIAALKQQGGKHLVIVRYAPDHTPHQDWVYNEADIDNATVIWAREMDPASNARLLRYFHDRKIWLIEPDRDLTALKPYRAE